MHVSDVDLLFVYFVLCIFSGDRNIHLDLNPWWWLEASADVTDGVATLQYKYTPPLPPPPLLPSTTPPAVEPPISGGGELGGTEERPADSAVDTKAEKKTEIKDEIKAEIKAEKKAEKKKDKQAAAGSENQDFIRENNLVVKSMGRYFTLILRCSFTFHWLGKICEYDFTPNI